MMMISKDLGGKVVVFWEFIVRTVLLGNLNLGFF